MTLVLNQHAHAFNSFVSFCNGRNIHYSITKTALAGFFICNDRVNLLARILDENTQQDLREFFPITSLPPKTNSFYRPEYHFDRNLDFSEADTVEKAFREGQKYVHQQKMMAIDAIRGGDKLIAADAIADGLHAVQDFFAHSNYVNFLDGSADQIQSMVALFDGASAPPSELQITSYSLQGENPQNDPLHYTHHCFSKDCPRKNQEAEMPAPTGRTKYQQAYADAVAASITYVISIRNAVSAEAWAAFVGGCACGSGASGTLMTNARVSGSLTAAVSSCPPTYPIEIITSGDPNDKAGSQGFGQERYLAAGTPLRYAISFGNEKTASAPACRVSITDPLDATSDNLITFGLGPISFGDQVVTPPAAIGSYSKTVDLRPSQNLLVAVDAHMDINTNSAVWTLQCLDPKTNRPPADSTAGFLPPGGNGSVFFTVMPKKGAPTNTEIQNQATIVFDKNPAIPTSSWVNTLDGTSPTSHVAALPATESISCFVVPWTGSDVGSGLAKFKILASDNGGAYAAWLSNTTAAAAVFNGQPGHSYSFYSQATDLVGNVEVTKVSPEATTTVVAGASCNGRPTLTGSIASKSRTATTEVVTLQFTNNGVGNAQSTSLNQIIFRTLAGSGTVKLAYPAVPIQLGSVAAGASTTSTVTLDVPSTVKEFSIMEQGTLKDVSGNTYAFSIGQAIFP